MSEYKSRSTMTDRFTVNCFICGFLTSARTFKEALENAQRLKKSIQARKRQ
jgi:hypothetical protein